MQEIGTVNQINNSIMKIKMLSMLGLFMFLLGVKGQSQEIRIDKGIYLLKDSLDKKLIISNLNSFLKEAEQENENNQWVLESQKLETYLLLDELKNIQKSGRFNDEKFYKPYLNNMILLEENLYFIQLSYIGESEGESKLRACFEILAQKENGKFVFASPLIYRTRKWKSKKSKKGIFRYQHEINTENIETYERLSEEFDRKLKNGNKLVEFYCCENIIELQRLVGVQYKIDYNGRTRSNWTSSDESRKLIVLGNGNSEFNNFDTHDLWHDRLSLKISRRAVNKPVDEACAYLYAGSWGYSWDEILQMFMENIASNKNSDWIEYKNKPHNFGESRAKHLMVDYVVTALIVEKLEKEQGFDAVWNLLMAGPVEKGHENYFNTLEKLSGVSKSEYNKWVWQLIEAKRG